MTAVPRETRLFTLRMWQEAVGGDQAAFEWRGEVGAAGGRGLLSATGRV